MSCFAQQLSAEDPGILNSLKFMSWISPSGIYSDNSELWLKNTDDFQVATEDTGTKQDLFVLFVQLDTSTWNITHFHICMDEPRTNYWNEPVGDLTVRFRVRTAVLTVAWCLGVLVSRLFRESSCCSPALLREKEPRRLLPGQPGGDDERLSCEMFVCLPQPCNTCCTFEDAFPSFKLGNAWSHTAFFLFLLLLLLSALPCLPIPQKSHHLQSICSICCGWTRTPFFFFFFFFFSFWGYDTRCSCFFSVLFQTHIFMSCFVSVWSRGRGSLIVWDAEWAWSELRGPAAHAPHYVPYGYERPVALLIV